MSEYKVGERVGIFSIFVLSEEEVILGIDDHHLDVRLSVCKLNNGKELAVSTLVHVHNTLGRLYMLFVTPAHKIIAPSMIKLAI